MDEPSERLRMNAPPIPGSDDTVIRRLLIANAEKFPHDPYATFEDGSVWTWSVALFAACGAAWKLRSAGVKQGDHVAVMLPNGPDYLRAWWGAAMLGAVLVPINLAYRGNMLGHLLALSKPVAMVIEPGCLDRFDAFRGTLSGSAWLSPESLRHLSDTIPEVARPIEYWDIHALMLTSGTTGPSKLSATTYRHAYMGGSWFLHDGGCGPEDAFLADLPLFHLGAMYHVTASLKTRTRIIVRSRPDFRRYWEIVRANGATAGLLLATMASYLMSQPARAIDREHGMRLLISAPLPRDIEAFQTRFGIERIRTAFGLTEVPGAIISDERDPFAFGYCGRARAGFELRLVDEHDREVPVNAPGELIVRAAHPWSMSAGYVGDDSATANAWRNGWFHTGDVLKTDDEGRFFFVDRVKDSVRRRGENISTAEVEAELMAHPNVADAACVAYRMPGTIDDELKAWIVPVDGVAIDFVELLEFAVERLPHFMAPRFFEIAADWPKTASGRVQKFALRERGNSSDTWDREAAGFSVTREGIVAKPASQGAP